MMRSLSAGLLFYTRQITTSLTPLALQKRQKTLSSNWNVTCWEPQHFQSETRWTARSFWVVQSTQCWKSLKVKRFVQSFRKTYSFVFECLTMSRSVSSSLKWLRPFIGGLGESLSDKMMTSSSSGDGGRFSLFILLHIRGRMKCQYILNWALMLYVVNTKQDYISSVKIIPQMFFLPLLYTTVGLFYTMGKNCHSF